MNRQLSFHRFLALLPIRWRLALVSFGLLALLLTALGILISTTEEQTLLTSQASALSNDAHTVQTQMKAMSTSKILTFPTITKEVANNLVGDIQPILGQNVRVSILSFDGSILAKNLVSSPQDPQTPAVTVTPASVKQWLTAKAVPPYLLVNDSRGQRELVILQPLAIPNKVVGKGLPGYMKALLQLNVSTTAIDQSIATTRLILALGILAALGIAAALTLPLINVALRPLVEMERVSSRIAAGALSLRLAEPPAHDEIGRLARAFNSMVARLETAFARQKRFVADVSHELRTPLTGLGGSLEMFLLRAVNGDEEIAYRLMSGMYAEVERMQRLVVDLLALAKLDEGHIRLQVEAVAVAPLVNEVCEQVQGLIDGQELSAQVPPDLPALRGNADQLRRVLLNIVENALKFTPPAGCIELVARQESAEFIRLEVRDTGIGISPVSLPYVFDRFYRSDPSRTRSSLQVGGSGLGLSLAKEIVEAHGGTITISSVVGKGTTVSIQLPVMS